MKVLQFFNKWFELIKRLPKDHPPAFWPVISCQTNRRRAWIPDVGREYLMSFHLKVKFFSMLGAGLGFPSELRSSKVRLIVLLSNRMTSGIHTRSAAFATLQDFANPQFLFIGLDGIFYCVVFILFFLALWCILSTK